jgi:hypothetical protein
MADDVSNRLPVDRPVPPVVVAAPGLPAASDVESGEIVVAEAPASVPTVVAPAPLPARRRRGSRRAPSIAGRRSYGLRLVAFSFLLVGLAAAAVGAYVGLGSSSSKQSTWSAWTPSSTGMQKRASEISAHVAPAYRASDGQPIVQVLPQAESLSGQPILGYAIAVDGRQDVYMAQDAVAYQLCGASSDEDCTLPGTPTVERGAYLRREALELALYTFKYTRAKGVIAYLPPVKQAATSSGSSSGSSSATDAATTDPTAPTYEQRAVAFRRTDLSAYLGKPLAETLTSRVEDVTAPLASREQQILDTTSPTIFQWSYESEATGVAVFLQPLTS